MSKSLTEMIEVMPVRCDETELILGLADMSRGQLSSFSGKLHGPHCKYSRTLPSTISLPECVCKPDSSELTQQKVTDPCYWTPQMPFLYNLELEIVFQNGDKASLSETIGFRRWETCKKNLLLERKRTVLRGVWVRDEAEVDLAAAHEAELAVAVHDPSKQFLQQASELGVMVIADLRIEDQQLTQRLLSLTWQPSVAMVLPNDAISYVPHAQMMASYSYPAHKLSPEKVNSDLQFSVWTVDIGSDEKMPTHLQAVEMPMLALRRGVEFSDWHEARAACDRLQADLAPEFDLAGYFVAS